MVPTYANTSWVRYIGQEAALVIVIQAVNASIHTPNQPLVLYSVLDSHLLYLVCLSRCKGARGGQGMTQAPLVRAEQHLFEMAPSCFSVVKRQPLFCPSCGRAFGESCLPLPIAGELGTGRFS